MQKNEFRDRASRASSHGHPTRGCGAVGRTGGRASSAHRIPSTSAALPGGWTAAGYRPSSAKEWVERCQQRRELEHIKNQQWEAASNHFKASQFRANFFNAKPAAPRCCSAQPAGSPPEEFATNVVNESSQTLEPEQDQVQPTKTEDGKVEDFFSPKKQGTLLGPADFIKPEIAALKSRLEELRASNAEERLRLNEQLNHRAWQASSVQARKLESQRLNEFVRSAWVDQRQWREDQRRRQELEDLRIQQEAERMAREVEERCAREAQHRHNKREQYQRDLEEQLNIMRQQEAERRELEAAADRLSAERHRLLDVEEQRQRLLQTRRARSLAVSWSRQHHIKLRQRAAQVLLEVAEDAALMQELQKQSSEQERQWRTSNEQEDVSLVLRVLEEHRALELKRQQEYDLLFSEEAARLWRCREQQWDQEQRARQELLQEVLHGRQQQLQQKLEANQLAEDRLHSAREETSRRVAKVEDELNKLLPGNESSGHNTSSSAASSKDELMNGGSNSCEADGGEAEAAHRKEIARLEAEMAWLWGPLYKPPHYGRKKVQW